VQHWITWKCSIFVFPVNVVHMHLIGKKNKVYVSHHPCLFTGPFSSVHSQLSIPFSLPILISHTHSDSSFLIHWCICRMWRQLKELRETQGYSSTTASLTVMKWVGRYLHLLPPLRWRWRHHALLYEAKLHCIGVHVHCIGVHGMQSCTHSQEFKVGFYLYCWDSTLLGESPILICPFSTVHSVFTSYYYYFPFSFWFLISHSLM